MDRLFWGLGVVDAQLRTPGTRATVDLIVKEQPPKEKARCSLFHCSEIGCHWCGLRGREGHYDMSRPPHVSKEKSSWWWMDGIMVIKSP
jgi:hypothetical protein